jgi:hypothetical protein
MLDLRRRQLITLLGGAAAAWPLAARAQQTERIGRVGVLMPVTAGDAEVRARSVVFKQTLQQLGWTVGENLQIGLSLARWRCRAHSLHPSIGISAGREPDARLRISEEISGLQESLRLLRAACN